jgi:probable rRNA maturation factor
VVDRFRPRTPRAFVERVVDAARRSGRRPALPVSVLLTGEREIARLHGRYLDDARATDVLSFADADGVELVVSVERARREARARGHAIRAELALYLAHGVLHACGFDDRDARSARAMRDAEQRVLRALGLRVAPF